jgi:YhcH/YjgK/YiaL family protein
MKPLFSLTLILALLIGDLRAQGNTKVWTTKQVDQWFQKKEWLNGLALQPHETINKAELARQYQLNKVYWDKAFAYLKEPDLKTLPNGRYPIDGENVFVFITENPTKNLDSTQWESHKNYVDLHYIISGEEMIGDYPITKLMLTKPYDASKDIANYSGTGKLYAARPGTFFIFFPDDGHRPSISPGGNKPDKKIVIKIRYAE